MPVEFQLQIEYKENGLVNYFFRRKKKKENARKKSGIIHWQKKKKNNNGNLVVFHLAVIIASLRDKVLTFAAVDGPFKEFK